MEKQKNLQERARLFSEGEREILTATLLRAGERIYKDLQKIRIYRPPEINLLKFPLSVENIKKTTYEVLLMRLNVVKRSALFIADIAF